MADTRLYIVRTKWNTFDYDRHPKLTSVAGHTEDGRGKIIRDHRVIRDNPAEFVDVQLFDLSPDEVEALRSDPVVLSIEPAKDGKFIDTDHEEEIWITDDGTRWDSGDPI